MKIWLKTVLAASLAMASGSALAEEIVVYSTRNEQLIKPIFDAYTKETGVQIKFITDKEGPLLQRLKSEGANSPADILLTVDAGNLWFAAKEGLLKPVRSQTLLNNVPKHLRDPKNQWFGLSIRARTIFYNPNKVKAADLSTYEALAGDQWKNRLCLRTSKKVYNQSLVAMLIAEHGEAKTEKIVQGWVNNLATDVFPDDTKMLEAIAAGQCDVGIANSYYYGRLLNRKPDLSVKIFWANQKTSGVHVNISGAGLTRHAKNEKAAIRFMEWLSSDKAQNLYTDNNMEFPVNPKVKPVAAIAAWGAFKANPLNVVAAGENQATAVKLMDRVGYR